FMYVLVTAKTFDDLVFIRLTQEARTFGDLERGAIGILSLNLQRKASDHRHEVADRTAQATAYKLVGVRQHFPDGNVMVVGGYDDAVNGCISYSPLGQVDNSPE